MSSTITSLLERAVAGERLSPQQGLRLLESHELVGLARAADAVVADSRATASLVHRYLGIRRDRVRVVHAAAPPWYRPVHREEARAALVREFGLSREYVLCVSTIEPRKDHLTLLRAMESVPIDC